ncbi:MAG: 2-oxoacid:acceptor oxidoreductase subunit alpha [Acidobacteriota bacterium]|nr:2-oxoacid:acceptor oxidoreductase subunit alpha [Acidobacteriota bacterium]
MNHIVSPVTAKIQKDAVTLLDEHIVEIVSDSGEGAQTAGQIFGQASAMMGNGVWTVEIIPAEIEPPSRSVPGASGNRIRVGARALHNAGDKADVVIGFNEQVLYSRIDQGAFKKGTHIFLENKWENDPREDVRNTYNEALTDLRERGYKVTGVPMEACCLEYVRDARRGKNIWVLGLLCRLYNRDKDLMRKMITRRFQAKGEKVLNSNLQLFESGFSWARSNLTQTWRIPPRRDDRPHVVMNGNQALAMGCMAAGMEICSMYPITPATSVSHYLAANFKKVGGFVHQAEDEIAAIGFAIGASYAGKTAVTITSGPGLALKTEFIGLAVMAEVPLVIVDVQRGGPSTGLPTKVEQSDLLAVLHGSPGDAPKIVLAPSTIEECFHFMITARRLAEEFRGPVFVLSDANLATGVQPFPRPRLSEDQLSPPIDQSDWDPDVAPYNWDSESGLSRRPIPGQRGGAYVLTGLGHDRHSKVVYESGTNQKTIAMRSKKLAALQRTLKPPTIFGDDTGDLLVVGWGSTRGAVEEAVTRLRKQGRKISSVNLQFLSPLQPGLTEMFRRFKKVMTIEINYSDKKDDPAFAGARRPAQLAMLLRARTLIDIDFWSRVPGSPLQPGILVDVLKHRMDEMRGATC